MSDSLLARIANPTAGQPAPLNPLLSAQQGTQLMEGINRNKLFAAQQAVGRAYQQATDPNTGAVDPARAQALIASDPTAAPAAAEAATSGQALRGSQLGFNQAQSQQVATGVASMLTQPDGAQNRAAYATTLQQLASQGVIDAGHLQAAMAALPPQDAPPSAFKQFGARLLVSSVSGPQAAGMLFPSATTINNGQTIQGAAVAGAATPNAGAITPQGGSIQQVTSPGENAGLVPVTIPDPANPGRYIKTLVPRGTLPGASGVLTDPDMGGAGGMTPTKGNTQIFGMPPETPPAVANEKPTRAAVGPVLADAPPGVAPAQAADTQAFAADRLGIPAKNTSVQNLQHAYNALQLTTSGKSTETTHGLYAYLQAQGLLKPGETDDLKNYELFRKYTERNIADLGNAAGTDAGRALAAQSNAGTSLSTPANLEVLRNDIGKQRQAIAQVMTAPDQETGIGYAAHAAQFSSNTDPRGFQWDMLPPSQQKTILSGMKPGTQAWNNLHRAIGMASKFGLFTQPQRQ